MIDGIKLYIKNMQYAKQLLQNPDLDFVRHVSESTGEIKNENLIAKHKKLKISILYENKKDNKGNEEYVMTGGVRIEGSIHKYHNHGKHNYNNYTLLDIFNTLLILCNFLGNEILSIPLQNVEIGLNINSPIPTSDVLESLVLHKRNQIKIATFNNSDFHEAQHQQYYVKIYDKSIQYTQPDDILRVEVKYSKMIALRKTGLHTLADLINPKLYPQLKAALLAKWNDVLLIDPTIRKKELTSKQLAKLKDWENPRYWLKLAKDEKSYKLNKEITKYKKLIAKHSGDIHAQILNRLSDKWQELTNIPAAALEEKRQKLTDILENTPKSLPRKRLRPTKKKKPANTNTLNKPLKFANKKKKPKKCKITGLDISMQKDNSSFLCTSGIKYYQKHRPDIYKELEKRLSPKWQNEPEATRIDEIHHSIRNEYFNIKNNTKRSIKKILSHPSLFKNPEQFIRPEKRKISNYDHSI